jgi:transglutaminase-like putative cysteine protease
MATEQERVDRLRAASSGASAPSPAPVVPRRSPAAGARRLTSLGSWGVTVAVVLTGLGLVRGDVWMYLLALLAASALLVSWVMVPRLPPVEVTLVAPAVEPVGTTTRARLVLRAGAHPVPRHHLAVFSVGDRLTPSAGGHLLGAYAVVEPLAARESRTVEVDLHPQTRGLHDRIATQQQTVAPFALVRRARVTSHPAQRLVVAGVDPARARTAGLDGDGDLGPVTLSRSGPDVHSLRAWSPGDGTGVHWRTTARRGEPVVVDRETRERTGLVVVLGPASTVEGEDAVVARAAGLALAAARTGAEVHLVSSRGVEPLAAHEADDLLRWTAVAGPASPEAADEAARLAGDGGRVLVVHDAPAALTAWRAAAEGHGAEVVDLVVDPRPTDAAPDLPLGDLTRHLRGAILASLAGGVLALLVGGVLTGSAVLWSVVLAGAWVSTALRAPTPAEARVRTLVSTGVIAVAGLVAFQLIGADELAAGAGTLLCGITTAQLVSARTRRDGLVALSLGPVMLVTAAGFGPGPALVLPVVVVAAAVLVGLAAVAGSALEDGAAPSAPDDRRAAFPPGTVPAVAASVVLGLVAFLVLPLGSAPTMGTSLLGQRQRTADPAQEAALRTPSYFGDAMDLAARGRLPDTVAFTVAPGAPPLWRAQALAYVLDGVWSSDSQRDTLISSDGRVVIPGDPSEAGAPAGESREFTVRPTGVAMLVAPGPPLKVAGEVVLEQQQTAAFVIDSGLAPYDVTAVPRESVDALSRSGSGPDTADAVLTSPDPTTTVRTEELARTITAGITDRVQQVRAVESWLRANVRYQLDAPLPPEDQNAVDFLLFDSRAGFCEHFAAAETILLRSLGIPSRIATGYAVSDETRDGEGWLVVKDSDAHAWVEVWIEGHGWVTSDPTAGSALLDPSADPSPVQQLRDLWSRLWADDAGRRLLAVGLVVLASIGTAVVLLMRRRRSGYAGPLPGTARSATIEPLAAFGRLRTALVADGHPFGPGAGVADVRHAVAGDTELLAALDVVERTLYDRDLPPAQQRLAVAALLDARTAALVARRSVPAGG